MFICILSLYMDISFLSGVSYDAEPKPTSKPLASSIHSIQVNWSKHSQNYDIIIIYNHYHFSKYPQTNETEQMIPIIIIIQTKTLNIIELNTLYNFKLTGFQWSPRQKPRGAAPGRLLLLSLQWSLQDLPGPRPAGSVGTIRTCLCRQTECVFVRTIETWWWNQRCQLWGIVLFHLIAGRAGLHEMNCQCESNCAALGHIHCWLEKFVTNCIWIFAARMRGAWNFSPFSLEIATKQQKQMTFS